MGVLGGGAMPGACFAQDRDFEKELARVQLRISKVQGNVYMIDNTGPEFSGGNIAALVGPDGVVLADTKFAQLGPKIEAALASIAPQPVRYVITTQTHADHAHGNRYFGPKAIVVAQQDTRDYLAKDNGPDEPAEPVAALPKISFTGSFDLHINGERVRVEHAPSAHTDGDAIVWFEGSKVVHMGDNFFAGMFPFLGEGGRNSVQGMITAGKAVLEKLPADGKIVPGHGPLASKTDLQAYVAMLEATSAIVFAGIDQHKTVQQLQKEKVLAQFDRWSKGYVNADSFIEILAAARKSPAVSPKG
jgi:cyclase